MNLANSYFKIPEILLINAECETCSIVDWIKMVSEKHLR